MGLNRILAVLWVVFSLSLLCISLANPVDSRLQYWLSLMAPLGFFALVVMFYWFDQSCNQDDET